VGTVREVPGCRWQSICTINQVISACFIFFQNPVASKDDNHDESRAKIGNQARNESAD
jgi:hypothetical protein